MIGVEVIPLRRFEDERGWFLELARASWLPKEWRQTNVSFSRKGTIRGLHYHERGQDDLFACLQGTARVVVLDRETGETFTQDIGDDSPAAVYIPGRHAHGFEALTDLIFCYHVTEEYDPDDPDEQAIAWNDPRVAHLWRTRSPILSERDAGEGVRGNREVSPQEEKKGARGGNMVSPTGAKRRVVVTGAGGQLGHALVEAFVTDEVLALHRADWDVTLPPPRRIEADLVLHTAAWTDVDGAEDDPQGAAAVNVGGTLNAASIGAPLVYFSSDYVFDGRKREPYVESDAPSPLSAYGRSKSHGEAAAGEGAWIVRSSWLFGPTGHNFVRTMLRLGSTHDEVAVVDDQRGAPTYVGHLAEATRTLVELPSGVYHVAAEGDCTWAEFAEAIFEDAGLDCRVRRITTAELARPAARPAYSVLRSEKPETPVLPNWREGLRECLARLG